VFEKIFALSLLVSKNFESHGGAILTSFEKKFNQETWFKPRLTICVEKRRDIIFINSIDEINKDEAGKFYLSSDLSRIIIQ